jgi:undecaprenyl-diphosphatase
LFVTGSQGAIVLHYFSDELYFDQIVKNAINSIANPALDSFMAFITNLGAPVTFYILAAVGFVYLISKQKIPEGIFLLLCIFTSWGVMNSLKLLFMRARPAGEPLTYAVGYSFPSGHATLAMAFYGFIIYLIMSANKNSRTKWLSGFIAALIFLIGISRIYLNVHYATDVLAGFILGSILLGTFIILLRYFKSRLF